MQTLTKEDMKMFLDLDVKFSTGTILLKPTKWDHIKKNKYIIYRRLQSFNSSYMYNIAINYGTKLYPNYEISIDHEDFQIIWEWLMWERVTKVWALGAKSNIWKLDRTDYPIKTK